MNPDQPTPLKHPKQPLNDVTVEQPRPPLQQPAEPVILPPLAAPPKSSSATPAKVTYHPKRFRIMLGSIVALCLVAVATMVVVALAPFRQGNTAPSDKANSTAPSERVVAAKQAIAHVKEYFKADGIAKSGISLPVRAAGKDFYTTIPDPAVLSSVAGEVLPAKRQSQLASIVHSLEGDGFTLHVRSNSDDAYLAEFSGNQTFCEVSANPLDHRKVSFWVEVRCADMSTYNDYAAAQEPLVRLYTPLSATSALYGFSGKPTPTASKTSGYSTVELPVSAIADNKATSTGAYALFYQTPDGLWHYFTDRDTVAGLDCSAYNSRDLQFAYVGTPCRTSSTTAPSVVELPKKP